LAQILFAGSTYQKLQNGTKIMFIAHSKLELLLIRV